MILDMLLREQSLSVESQDSLSQCKSSKMLMANKTHVFASCPSDHSRHGG